MSRSRSRSRGRGGGDLQATVERLLAERDELRKKRDYREADKVRDELKDMGVNVHDNDGTWEGPNGLRGSTSGRTFSATDRSLGGGDEKAQIQRLLDERNQLRSKRDFQAADKIREELKEMGVNVHDKDGTWTGPNGLRGSNGVGGGGNAGGRDRDDDRRGGFAGYPPPGAYGPPLPPGWEMVHDPASGRPYFCNRATGETSWTPPPMGPPPLPAGWEQVHDYASGRPYFCNRATGQTSWVPPSH